jgi:hypothetical protein
MSLRETLEGAQREAQEAGNLPTRDKTKAKSKDKSKTKGDKGDRGSKSGETRDVMTTRTRKSSAAGAKPSREAASSVRVVSSDGSSRSSRSGALASKKDKEVEKAEKRKQREREDFRSRGYELLLRKEPEYQRTDRIWWILIGIGFGMTIIALIMAWAFPADSTNLSTMIGIISVAALVLAYALIIGAFVYDWIKRRPIRKRVERTVASYSDKKIGELLEEESRVEAERRAAKAAKKAAKKGEADTEADTESTAAKEDK